MARPLAVVTDVPADRVAALQAAFAATMKRPAISQRRQEVGLDINWIGGPALTEMVRQVEETPQPVVDRLRESARARGREIGGREPWRRKAHAEPSGSSGRRSAPAASRTCCGSCRRASGSFRCASTCNAVRSMNSRPRSRPMRPRSPNSPQMGVDVINPSGAPPFMVLGYAKEQDLIRRWEAQYNTRIFTSGTSNIDAHACAQGEAHPRHDLFSRRHQQDLRAVLRGCRLRMPRHGRHRRRFPQGAGAAEQQGLSSSSRMRSAATNPPRRSTCWGRPGPRSTSSSGWN